MENINCFYQYKNIVSKQLHRYFLIDKFPDIVKNCVFERKPFTYYFKYIAPRFENGNCEDLRQYEEDDIFGNLSNKNGRNNSN
jgi:hypothetical protein